MADLKRRFTENARRNLFLAGELLQLLALFESRGVRCLAFKGPVQAEHLYGSIALREFVDLDLLVRAADVPKAAALLAERNYTPQAPLTSEQEGFLLRTHCERNFARADERCFIDLHWAFTDDQFPFALRTDDLLARLESATLGGAQIKTVGREDLLLLLSVHAAKDLFSRLESICAVAEVARAGEKMDWSRVFRLAAETRCVRRLLLALELARDLLDAPLPPEVLAQVQHEQEAVATLVREARSRLFCDGGHEIGAFERSLWAIRVLDNPRDGRGAVLRSIFWPNLPDWAIITFPAPLFFLYYLVRPVRLVGKYLRKSLGRRDRRGHRFDEAQ